MNTQPNNLLIDDHSKLDEMLDQVFAALRDGYIRQTFDRLDYFWARLAVHIRAEHSHLFPSVLRSIGSGKEAITERVPSLNCVADLIGQLRADHDHFMKELAGSVKEMRELVATDNSDASPQLARVAKRLEDLRSRLQAHNELEETEIYPLAALMFDPAERNTLNLQIKKELKNCHRDSLAAQTSAYESAYRESRGLCIDRRRQLANGSR